MTRQSAGVASERRRALQDVLRYGIYFVVVTGFVLALPRIIRHWGLAPFVEGGPVEGLQLCLLALIIGLLSIAYVRVREWRAMCSVLLAFFGWCFVRENDSYFDELLPLVRWTGISIAVLSLCAVLTCIARASLWPGFQAMLKARGIVLLWAGLVLLAPLAQGIGHQPLLGAIFSEGYTHIGKHTLEETLEVIGYAVCLFGVIELLVEYGRLRSA